MNESGLCKCGCGGITGIARQNDSKRGYIKGSHVDYIRGHVKFNGGKYTHTKGYAMIKQPGHHRADKRGYVFEHILIVEKLLGRLLNDTECVHHKDKNKKNNYPDNLEVLFSNTEHKLQHLREKALLECGDSEKRKCKFCKEYDDINNLRKALNKNIFIHLSCWQDYYQKNREHFNELQRVRRRNAKQTNMASSGREGDRNT